VIHKLFELELINVTSKSFT